MTNKDPKITKPLTEKEIIAEVDKIEAFFRQIPDELKAWAADNFIYEIVNWGASNYYEALGIFQEAMGRYRESLVEKESEQTQYEHAVNSTKKYRCVKQIEHLEELIVADQVYFIGLAGYDPNYAGGKKYYIINEEGDFIDICQHVLDQHFELEE